MKFSNRLGRWLAFRLPFLLFLLPLLPRLPGIGGFPYPGSGGGYSDLAVSHYPNAFFIQQSLEKWSELPLWSPTILGGYPLAANPLSSLWYPPAWLVLALPLPFGLNLLALLHLLWGGVGMYLLLRSSGLCFQAALLGGLAFEALPKLAAHYGAGHLTLIYAVPWTPWLLLTARENRARRAAPLLLALVFLADVRWAAYAWPLWGLFALPERLSTRPAMGASNLKRGFRALGEIGVVYALAALLSAPLALPLLEYTRLSTRASLSTAEALEFSLPLEQLFGLVFPPLQGFYEWVGYPGVIVFALASASLFLPPVRRAARGWLLLLVISLALSLGENLPLLSTLYRLPGLDLLRVPPRALFLSGMAFSALAAFSVDHLLRESNPAGSRGLKLALAGLAAFTGGLPAAMYSLTGVFSAGFVLGGGLGLAGALWVGARLSGRLPARLWVAGLALACLLDWSVMHHSQVQMRPAGEALSEGAEAAAWLAERRAEVGEGEPFRSFSPSYSLPQQTAAFFGLELAEGVDPLQLEAYFTSLQAAAGFSPSGYSVTLPPFPEGDPAAAQAGIAPDARALGKWNVRYLLAEYDLPAEGLALRARFGDTRVYENLAARPRAWVEPALSQKDQSWTAVDSLQWSPNRIEIEARGPGLLVLAENAYPGWRVVVDGEPAALVAVEGVHRGVYLEPGRHRVVFTFFPLSLALGMTCAVMGWVLWGLGWVHRRRIVPSTVGEGA